MFKLFKPKSKSEKNEANYRKWLASYTPKNSQKIGLKRVFTDRNGNNYYVPTNVGQMTRERYIKMEEELHAASFGADKSEVEGKLSAILEEFSNFAWSAPTPQKMRTLVEGAQKQIADILYRLRYIKAEDSLLRAALYFILIDNENPYLVNPDTQQQKWDNIQSDPELRSFFLNTTEAILSVSANSSERTTHA
jgi:hypothetical protein